MAEKIKIQGPVIDASVAIAGAGLLDQFVVANVPQIGTLLANLPADVMGISVKMVILGAVSLVVFKNWIMKN